MSPLTTPPETGRPARVSVPDEDAEAPTPTRVELSVGKLGSEPATTLTLHFQGLPPRFLEAWAKELLRGGAASEGLVVPQAAALDEARAVLYFRPLELRTRILADLLGALPWRNEPGLVLWLAARLADRLEETSEWPHPPTTRGSLTPRSIFISPSGQVRLLGGGPRTRHTLLGRSHAEEVSRWAAPELLAQGPSQGAEVHALAALVYELSSGRPLRPEPDFAGLEEKRGSEFAGVLRRALSPHPERRPASPRAFVAELARALTLDPSDAASEARLTARLRALPHDPGRAGLSALVPRAQPEAPGGRDPGEALAAWGPSVGADRLAPLPRGHSSGIEPILLGQDPRTESRASAPSGLEPEPYRIESRPASQRRPSLEDVLSSRRRRRRVRWLAGIFVLLLISAIAHQTLDLPLAHWLHSQLAGPEAREPPPEP